MFGNRSQMNTEAGTNCARSSSCAPFEKMNDNFSADGKIILSAVLFICTVVAALISLVLVQSVGIIISVALVVRLITVIIINKTQPRVKDIKSLI